MTVRRSLTSWSAPATAVCFISLFFARSAHAQEFAATGQDCSQNGMACRYWLPEGYDQGTKYPLLVFLHGAGQRGTDNRAHVEDWGVELLQTVLSAENRAQYPAFVLAPQCPSEGEAQWVDWPWANGSYDIGQIGESAPLKEARLMLARLQTKYSIDADRLYVTGTSMGGFGAWDLVSRTPELFAAAVPTDGGGSPQAAKRLQNLAVWAFHFADDGSVPVSSDREMFAALAAAGARPIYSEAERGGHGAQGYAIGSPGLLAWLFAQRRGVPGTPVPSLGFAPPGGRQNGVTTVSLSTTGTDDAGAPGQIHYTLDSSVPSGTRGTPYVAPIEISKSSIVTAVSSVVDDDFGERRMFHAEPYQLGAEPLPGGLMLMEPSPMSRGGPASGGTAGGGAGGKAETTSPGPSTGDPSSAGGTTAAMLGPAGGTAPALSTSESGVCSVSRGQGKHSLASGACGLLGMLLAWRRRR